MADERPVNRRGGRPRAAIPKSSLSVWVPTVQHDQLIRLARHHDVSVSALVGRVLARALKHVDDSGGDQSR